MFIYLILIFVFIAGALLLWQFNRQLHRGLTAAREPITVSHENLGPNCRLVSFQTRRDRCLNGWWFTQPQARGVIVVVHGWGANRELMLPLARPLVDHGWLVLLYDARNHGDSDTDTFSSMPRFAEDAEAAVDWVQRQPEATGLPVVLLGHSVGAAASLLAASRRSDIRAVVSLSAFAHPGTMMQRWIKAKGIPYIPLGWYTLRYIEHVIGHRYDDIAPVTTVGKLKIPVLIGHGRDDDIVPFRDAERIFDNRGDADVCLLPLTGGHDLTEHMADHLPRLEAFLDPLAPSKRSVDATLPDQP